MGIRRKVSLLAVSGLRTAALFGFFRPRILVPDDIAQRLDSDELRVVLLHELAHLKKGDVVLNWLVIALRSLHWFNPLIWLGLRRFLHDRELVRDAWVIGHLPRGADRCYGRTLIKLLESFTQSRLSPSAATILTNKHEIRRRVAMIGRPKTPGRLVHACCLGLCLGLAAVTFTAANADEHEEAEERERHEVEERELQQLRRAQMAEFSGWLREAHERGDKEFIKRLLHEAAEFAERTEERKYAQIERDERAEEHVERDEFAHWVEEMEEEIHELREAGKEDRAEEMRRHLESRIEARHREDHAGAGMRREIEEAERHIHELLEQGKREEADAVRRELAAFMKQHERKSERRLEVRRQEQREERANHLQAQVRELTAHLEEVTRAMHAMRRELDGIHRGHRDRDERDDHDGEEREHHDDDERHHDEHGDDDFHGERELR